MEQTEFEKEYNMFMKTNFGLQPYYGTTVLRPQLSATFYPAFDSTGYRKMLSYREDDCHDFVDAIIRCQYNTLRAENIHTLIASAAQDGDGLAPSVSRYQNRIKRSEMEILPKLQSNIKTDFLSALNAAVEFSGNDAAAARTMALRYEPMFLALSSTDREVLTNSGTLTMFLIENTFFPDRLPGSVCEYFLKKYADPMAKFRGGWTSISVGIATVSGISTLGSFASTLRNLKTDYDAIMTKPALPGLVSALFFARKAYFSHANSSIRHLEIKQGRF